MHEKGGQNVQKVCFSTLLPFLVPSYVSLYLLHQYSGEQSHIWKRKKRKSFEFWGPRGGWAKPRGKIQARSPCPSVGCLPGKHLHKLLAFKTRQLMPMYFRPAGPSRNWDSICFVLFFFSALFRTAAHNLSGINDVVNKMQQVCGWICLAGLVPVLPRDKPTTGLIYLPQPHPAALCTGRTTSQLITG